MGKVQGRLRNGKRHLRESRERLRTMGRFRFVHGTLSRVVSVGWKGHLWEI